MESWILRFSYKAIVKSFVTLQENRSTYSWFHEHSKNRIYFLNDCSSHNYSLRVIFSSGIPNYLAFLKLPRPRISTIIWGTSWHAQRRFNIVRLHSLCFPPEPLTAHRASIKYSDAQVDLILPWVTCQLVPLMYTGSMMAFKTVHFFSWRQWVSAFPTKCWDYVASLKLQLLIG